MGGAERDGAAIASKTAERGRYADRAACIGSDGGEGRAFLHAGSCSTGGTAGEVRRVERLKAVAEVAVLSRDAIRKLVEMRLTSNDGAGATESCGNGAVGLGDTEIITIERRAARRSETGKVEAVLERDGNSPEWFADGVFAVKIARLLA